MVMLFVMGRGGYRGDKEGARVLDPMGGGALRSPRAAITGLAPSAAMKAGAEDRSYKSTAVHIQGLSEEP